MPKLRRASSEENKEKADEQKSGEQVQHVGLVLRARRRELNISQAILAKKMQTSQEVISNYENGVTPVRADDLPRFASILEVMPVYFFEPNHQNIVAAPPSQAPNSQTFDNQAPAVPHIVARSFPQAAGKNDDSLKNDNPLKLEGRTSTGQAGVSAAEPNKAILNQAEHNKVALSALSEAELEEALLAYYRTLGGRMRTLAVKLIRELAQDEQQSRSQIVVWKANS